MIDRTLAYRMQMETRGLDRIAVILWVDFKGEVEDEEEWGLERAADS